MRFLFRLARSLNKTVSELLSSVDSVELTYWMAFSQLEPFNKDELYTALICATMANCWSSKEHRLSDFILDFEPPKQQTQEEIVAWFLAQKDK